MTHNDKLKHWCSEFLPRQVKSVAPLNLTTVSGDAGFRSYYRLNTQPPLIAVNAPPDQEDIPAFVDKALFFSANDINVPKIFAVDYAQGFMLIEDFGDGLLLPLLDRASVNDLYNAAENVLSQLQRLPLDTSLFPHYSFDKLQQEMALFPEWFVTRLLGISLTEADNKLLTATFQQLADSALSQPAVIVHRDYHARNLLLTENNQLGIIDFQDAVIGPITYDLVSLLRDCYIRWPADYVYSRVEQYFNQCRYEGVLQQVELTTFKRWFDLMGLQRHLKVLGIFSRLWLRDGKPQYLNDLPLVLRYALESMAEDKQLQTFHQWFLERLMPTIERQSWYKSWQMAGEKQ